MITDGAAIESCMLTDKEEVNTHFSKSMTKDKDGATTSSSITNGDNISH